MWPPRPACSVVDGKNSPLPATAPVRELPPFQILPPERRARAFGVDYAVCPQPDGGTLWVSQPAWHWSPYLQTERWWDKENTAVLGERLAGSTGTVYRARSTPPGLPPRDLVVKFSRVAQDVPLFIPDDYLESLIAHPQMLALVRAVLGEEIRWDHCVSLVRPKGSPAMGWHSHEYSEDDASLGFIRIFFYISGFGADDGGLKVIPGSHLYRDKTIRAKDDADMRAGWMAGKTHPATGEPLAIEHLGAPTGSVIIMWTHAAHGVVARKPDSTTRYCVVYAYRNPGRPSEARWITDAYEKKEIPGAQALLPLY